MPRLKSPDKHTDFELIELIKNGESWRLSEIIDRHKVLVSKTITSMVGQGDDAEDIGQETFIRFYRGIDKFRGESQLSTYLVRIAINLSLNHLKKIKNRGMISLFRQNSVQPIAIVENMSEQIGIADESELINKALNQLDAGSRAVITLRLIDGYSVKETSEMLGFPIGTVLSKQSRAQDKLKTILKNYI